MLASRERREDPFLEWKVRILSVSIALALGGMYFEERWMTGTALVLLFGVAVVRLAMGRRDGAFDEEDDDVSAGDVGGEDEGEPPHG